MNIYFRKEMTYKERTREVINNIVDEIKTIESANGRHKALGGVYVTLLDLGYEVGLELGEAAALDEINKLKREK